MNEVEVARALGGRVSVWSGDITCQAVDAIVNAANSTLLGGGGVDGAIHRAGGPDILAACRAIRADRYPDGLPTGEAVITPAGRLPARYVIHTVGPVYGRHGGAEARLLASCYEKSLALAAEHGLATIAFPAISTGAYGYPFADAAQVVARAVQNVLATDKSIAEVRLVFFGERQAACFAEAAGFAGHR
jgi:O-acetyl-ADP-ribose deacetylase (regulator of RNase III)